MFNKIMALQESSKIFGPPYNPNADRTFNQLTNVHYDTCSYENELRIGSKPMKYYVNQFNSPQINPFTEFTIVGNQKQYNVSNMYDHPMPTRLNPIYPTYVFPYPTSPTLGQQNPSREYANTETMLRFGTDLRALKSAADLSSVDYNRWEPNVSEITVQNAGQDLPGLVRTQQPIGKDGYYNMNYPNNVLFANSTFPYFGISSRNELHNYVQLNNC